MNTKGAIAFTFTLSITLLIFATIAQARQRSLRGEALQAFVADSTVYLKTPLGSLPISYSADGTMYGRSKRLARYTGSVADSGTWWIKRNKLCQRWNRWLDGKRQCFTLRARGNKIYWRRNDGKEGTARIARNSN